MEMQRQLQASKLRFEESILKEEKSLADLEEKFPQKRAALVLANSQQLKNDRLIIYDEIFTKFGLSQPQSAFIRLLVVSKELQIRKDKIEEEIKHFKEVSINEELRKEQALLKDEK